MFFVKSLVKPSTLLKYKQNNINNINNHKINDTNNIELSKLVVIFNSIDTSQSEYKKVRLEVYKNYILSYYLHCCKK